VKQALQGAGLIKPNWKRGRTVLIPRKFPVARRSHTVPAVSPASRLVLLLLVLCCSCITIMAQQNIPGDDPLLNVPSPAQVRKITIEPGGINAYTPQTLLKILPHLVADNEHVYGCLRAFKGRNNGSRLKVF